MTTPVTVPVGALQFEITRFDPFRAVLWVLPSVPAVNYTEGCNCRWVHPIIESLVPADIKPFMDQDRDERKVNGSYFVCACFGKVIE